MVKGLRGFVGDEGLAEENFTAGEFPKLARFDLLKPQNRPNAKFLHKHVFHLIILGSCFGWHLDSLAGQII
jgi:hypothetical protein